MSVRRILASNGMTFSKAVAIDGPGTWVYLSGQVGIGEDGRIVPGGTGPEARRALELLAADLAEAGGAINHFVRVAAHLTDLAEYGAYSTTRAEFFGDHLPASTAVGANDLLLGAHIEIDAIAFVPL